MAIKKDCFAYKEKQKKCSALNELVCEKRKCRFFKTKEQFNEEREKYPARGDLK